MPMAEMELEEGQKAVPIFGLGNLQRSPFVSTVDRVNALVEMTENGRQQAAIYGMPGLVEVASFGNDPIRAYFVRENELTFYYVIANRIEKLLLGGTPETLATLTTSSGAAWIADNGTQIFFNDGVTAWIYNTTTLVMAQITDPDYVVGARGGTFLQSRFWVYTISGANANRVYASDQGNGLAWDGLNFFTPEAIPDGIVAVDRWFNDLVVYGRASIEWWTGTTTPIVGALGFKPIAGANTEVGLIGELAHADAGQKKLFLGRSGGYAGIYELKTYAAEKVSVSAVDTDIIARTGHSTAVATGYTLGDHPIIQFSFRGSTESDSITWAVDVSNYTWFKRKSYGRPYYRGLLAVTSSERIFITDAFVGRIYEMLETSFVEGSDPLIFEVTSIHLLKNGEMFTVHACQIDMETGLGGAGTNPQAIIQISKDGGHTWSSENWKTMVGRTGEYTRRVRRRRIGSARDIAIRLRITDPVKRIISGAYLVLEEGLS